MVGDGPDRVAAEQLVDQLDINEKVFFRGKTFDVKSMLGISDIFLLPSETESFGLSALEAMASYVPVVASRVGGLGEVVDHEINGYLENIGDIDAMSKRALELLTNESKMSIFSASSRAKAESFSMSQISETYLALYKKIIDEKK